MRIEAASAERPWEGKGHDRVVLLEEIGRFALFDGAGQAMASDVAYQTFVDQHLQHDSASTAPLPPLDDIFKEIHARIQAYQDEEVPLHFQHIKRNIITTGVAVGVRTASDTATPVLEYAHAGDSSLWLFDHEANRLSKLTRDDIIGDTPDNCIPDVRNWLGAPEHQLEQYSSSPMESASITLALFSDGVGSFEFDEGAITKPVLREILGDAGPVQDKADQIIGASSIEDDASVIVVNVQA